MGAVSRGRHNIIPGATVFSLIGYIGQRTYAGWEGMLSTQQVALSDAASQETPAFRQGVTNDKWTLLKALSDDDYKHLLVRRIWAIESELASIEKEIRTLQNQAEAMSSSAAG